MLDARAEAHKEIKTKALVCTGRRALMVGHDSKTSSLDAKAHIGEIIAMLEATYGSPRPRSTS